MPRLPGQGRHSTVLVALAVLFPLYPVMEALDAMRLYRLAFLILLVAAVYSLSDQRRKFITALAIGVPTIVAQVFAVAAPNRVTLLAGTTLGLIFVVYVTVVLLRSVLSEGPVTADKIAGAISVYLLLGLLWSMVYAVIVVLDPQAFSGSAAAALSPEEYLRQGGEYGLIYYSFVTLTTLGYGDITPTTPLSQTFSWLEAVTGQLFIAVTIARLVAERIAYGSRADDERES